MSDDKRVGEIRARVEAATLGPWAHDVGKNCSWVYAKAHEHAHRKSGNYNHTLAECPQWGEKSFGQLPPQATANARFIAHARADIPYLLDALQQSEAREKRLREALTPFAEPHSFGDNYVQFAPRLIETARQALTETP